MSVPITRSSHLAEVARADRVVLLNLARLEQAPIVLVGPGAQLWHRVSSGADRDDLEVVLIREHNLDPAAASAEVSNFLVELEGYGLIDPTQNSSVDQLRS